MKDNVIPFLNNLVLFGFMTSQVMLLVGYYLQHSKKELIQYLISLKPESLEMNTAITWGIAAVSIESAYDDQLSLSDDEVFGFTMNLLISTERTVIKTKLLKAFITKKMVTSDQLSCVISSFMVELNSLDKERQVQFVLDNTTFLDTIAYEEEVLSPAARQQLDSMIW